MGSYDGVPVYVGGKRVPPQGLMTEGMEEDCIKHIAPEMVLTEVLAGARTEEQIGEALGLTLAPPLELGDPVTMALWCRLNHLVCSGLLFMQVVDARWHYKPSKRARDKAKTSSK